jgi:hypothetical protein
MFLLLSRYVESSSPYPDRMLKKTAWIAIGGAAALGLVIGLALGAVMSDGETTSALDDGTTTSNVTGSTSTPPASDTSDPLTPNAGAEIPTYGSDDDRQALVDAATALNITGVFADPELLLATADKICYDLERLQAQGRSPAYATRVVWNESLAELDSEDLAGFATAFGLAPTYLCPENAGYAEDVAYILGF